MYLSLDRQRLTLAVPLRLGAREKERLLEILKAWEVACEIVWQAARKHKTTHQVRLHALTYNLLTSMRDGERDTRLSYPLPAQYASRAIQRVAHEARLDRRGLAAPYPPRSFDVDSRCANLGDGGREIHITTLGARGTVGGSPHDRRLAIGLHHSNEEEAAAVLNGRLMGATLVLPKKGSPYALLRIDPRPKDARDLVPPGTA